jgi:hypothetical protein
VDCWFPLARKNPEIHFSTSEAGLSGQKTIKRTQNASFWVFSGISPFPKITKCPYVKNIIDTAFSFEDRSKATMFLEHVNFQPRVSKAKKIIFFKTAPT